MNGVTLARPDRTMCVLQVECERVESAPPVIIPGGIDFRNTGLFEFFH
jgi:hypothetical protein